MKGSNSTYRPAPGTTCRKPLTAGEIEELAHVNREIQDCGGVWLVYQASKIVNALPRLLSMLTPPPDAAVREAMESLQRMVDMDTFVEATAVKMQALMSYVRAVQAPRLNEEQVEAAFREGYGLGNDDGRNIDVFCHIKQHNPESDPDFAWEHSEARRAAFPELAGEVGRG